jgi:Domain of unknown function (DUF3331)
MREQRLQKEPWAHAVALLMTNCVQNRESNNDDRTPSTMYGSKSRCAMPIEEAIGDGILANIVDRPTSSTAKVEWRDAQSGHYGDQTWRLAKARCAGVCVVSKVAIRPGDLIFKPKVFAPMNADAMILASKVRPFHP